MSDDASARLGLPYLAAGQLQKHVTLNEALTRLDVLTQTAVVSRTTPAQPAAALDGTLYILPPGATGADWSDHPAGGLLRAEAGGWLAVDAPDGLLAVVLDSDEVLVRRSGAWVPLAAGASEPVTVLQNRTRLGVNTEADATNVVAARVNKALWTALESESGGDGDLRFTFNKQGGGDVLSLLFQSGWSGRAELGLVGDDDLRLKVSADGGTWHDAFSVDRTSGRLWFAQGATRRETTVLTSGGSWTPPAWARWVEAICVGGGGGGGSGAVGPAGTVRFGGGGGGAGGLVSGAWPVNGFSGPLAVVIGAGGSGGGAGVDSTVSAGGVRLLTGEGGKAGMTGAASSGIGGAGGGGLIRSNAGGDSSASAVAGEGQAQTRTDGPGGGGAGGGVSAANVAFSGGAGGDGAVLHVRAAGGLGRTTSGLSGQASPLSALSSVGGGGGGGGGAASGAGYPGAAGGLHGAGGGGGGAGVTAGGVGGAGAAGVVWLTAIG
ncbi:DUF2793 domain-containing protein [Brevundimonas sp. NPDC058933]|uniref:DUF2793 domain-containing protein n=1 Tax=Brevundimonas sp. NPDC058933 TaxID=3346673 RepID=UPI003BEEDA80